MRTHFWASLYTTLEVLPEMRARKEGRIVNVWSFGGKDRRAAHAALRGEQVRSRRAVHGLAELAGSGVVATTVRPGLMRTGSHFNAEFKGSTTANMPGLLGRCVPLLSTMPRTPRAILDAGGRGESRCR